MTRSASNVFHSSPMFDSVEVVRESKPPIKDMFCKYCCRLLRWVPKGEYCQAICCGRVYYERRMRP